MPTPDEIEAMRASGLLPDQEELGVRRDLVPHPGPIELPLEVRVAILERLVLELTKHIPPGVAVPPGAVIAIEEMKMRHPDV